MNSLAEATNRLCAEIVALRTQRKSLRRALQEQSLVRRVTVKEWCSDLHQGRLAMHRATGDLRRAFVNNLRRVVGTQRHEVRTDVLAARRAWMGRRPGSHFKPDQTPDPTGPSFVTTTTSRKDRRGGGPN